MSATEFADVLFASDLQQQPVPSTAEVVAAVSRVLGEHDIAWCQRRVAEEADEAPERCRARMRWARALARNTPVAAQDAA